MTQDGKSSGDRDRATGVPFPPPLPIAGGTGGIPSSCDGCGDCCEGIGSPVLVYNSALATASGHPHRPAGLPIQLVAEIDEHFLGLRRGEEPQERCLWFDAETRRCRHYEWRPAICREFELGGSSCLAVRAAARAGRDRGSSGK